jgi:CHAT domain-containing protein
LREIGLAIRNSLIADERLLAPLVAEELLSDHPVTVLRFVGPASGLGIPFELLGEGEEGGAWCLRRVIFRQLELTDHVSHKTQAFSRLIAHLLEKKEELRILFVAGSGARTYVYDSEIEALAEEVKADLRGLGLSCRVSMVPSSLASVSFLRQVIRDGRHHLLHYAGPGRWGESLPEGFPLKDGAAGVKSLSATGLADLVQSPDLHLVVLNGCPGSETDLFAGFFESLTQADIPAILLHRWPLTDEAGRLLASAFYHELWRTFSLGEALLAARRALVERREEGAAWSSPVLVLQNS